MVVMIFDQRPTKLSDVNPHTIEKDTSSASVVPSPQRTSVAIAANEQLRGMTTRGWYRSERYPVSVLPGTEAAVSQYCGCNAAERADTLGVFMSEP